MYWVNWVGRGSNAWVHKMAPLPHGEGLDLSGSHLLNHNLERQFAQFTCCSRRHVPFPSRQQAAFKVRRCCRNIWRLCLLLPQSLMPRSRHTKECSTLAHKYTSFVLSRIVFIILQSKCHQCHWHDTAHQQSRKLWLTTNRHPTQHSTAFIFQSMFQILIGNGNTKRQRNSYIVT